MCPPAGAERAELLYEKLHSKCKSRDAWVAQSAKRLPSAQVMVPGSWDRALHRAPRSAGNLLLPLPLPLLVFPISLCLYMSNK